MTKSAQPTASNKSKGARKRGLNNAPPVNVLTTPTVNMSNKASLWVSEKVFQKATNPKIPIMANPEWTILATITSIGLRLLRTFGENTKNDWITPSRWLWRNGSGYLKMRRNPASAWAFDIIN